jgi:predicted transport protein
MNKLKYVKPERMYLKNNMEFNEKWLQQKIEDDPSIMGLGDIILKDKERLEPHGGRLDLLFQEPESNQRYEVEIQLGKTDESHIIRTIEYWDIERKRYPQYDHIAVIIAEEITSRFFNIISLFNRSIPLVAIQINAFKHEENISLFFQTILDQRILGTDEEEEKEVVDRSYWEKRGTKETLAQVDELLSIIHTIDPDIELRYNKFYIGLAKEGQANNFAIFRPQKVGLRLEIRIPKSEELGEKMNNLGLDVMDYSSRDGRYRIRLNKEDIKKHTAFIKDLFIQAHS